MNLFTVTVNKAGYHKVANTEYICLGIINNDMALLVGEGKNITTAPIYECVFVRLVNGQSEAKQEPMIETKEIKKGK